MATTTTAVENVTDKAEALVLEQANGNNGEWAKEKVVNCENGTKIDEEQCNVEVQEQKEKPRKESGNEVPSKEEAKEEEVAVEVEPKTGVSFPVKLDDGKQLKSVGLRKKSMLGMGIKIYGFGNVLYIKISVIFLVLSLRLCLYFTGIYADDEKLRDLQRSKIGKAPTKATKEMYQVVIDSDVGMTVRMVIVFSSLTMSMVRKNFDEGLGASIKKLTGGKNDALANK